jgi:hypothetical protein
MFFVRWEMVNRIEISGEEEAWEKVESLNPLRCAGFVCIDADFNQLQLLSSKFILLKNSRTLQTAQQKALYILELLVDVPDAIRIYPFPEDLVVIVIFFLFRIVFFFVLFLSLFLKNQTK